MEFWASSLSRRFALPTPRCSEGLSSVVVRILEQETIVRARNFCNGSMIMAKMFQDSGTWNILVQEPLQRSELVSQGHQAPKCTRGCPTETFAATRFGDPVVGCGGIWRGLSVKFSRRHF